MSINNNTTTTFSGILIGEFGKITSINVSRQTLAQVVHHAIHNVYRHGVTEQGGFYGGKNSATGGGVAIGDQATTKSDVGTPIRAYQVGPGNNSEVDSLKFRTFRLVDALGKIPTDRLPPYRIELEVFDGYLQWKYEGTTTWYPLLSIDDITGADGTIHQVDAWGVLDEQFIIDTGNSVTSGNYIFYVTSDDRTDNTQPATLTGDRTGWLIGYDGDAQEWTPLKDELGITGPSGKQVELQNNGTYIQWKYEDDPSWLNLIALSALKGEKGDTGNTGADGREVVFTNDGTYIKWKYEDEPVEEYINLVSLSALTGATGEDGQPVELRVSSDWLQWKYVNEGEGDWKSIYKLTEVYEPANENIQAHIIDKNNPHDTDETNWEVIAGISGFRLPTEDEWNAERATWDSLNAAGAYDSFLKLTVSGNRYSVNGSLYYVGSLGYYWSSTVSGSYSRFLSFGSSNADTYNDRRADGYSVRLIKDEVYMGDVGGFVSEEIIADGLTYNTVLNPDTNRVWLDRNLGATKVAESSTDADAYGDLYQWGRAADGHEIRTSDLHDGETLGLATTEEPNAGNDWDGKFITISIFPYNWLETPNDNLWQGVDGINNPAPPPTPPMLEPKDKSLTVDAIWIAGDIVTEQSIVDALGYDPANKDEVIPLSGTEVGKPVTGNITTEGSIIFYDIPNGEDIYSIISSDDLMIRVTGTPYGLYLNWQGQLLIHGDVAVSTGISGNHYYGANYDDNTYTQKKYVDDTQKQIAGVVNFDLTAEVGEAHTINIIESHSGKTLRIVSNLDDEILVEVDNSPIKDQPITVFKDYEGETIMRALLPVVMIGSEVEAIIIPDTGWAADTPAYTFILVDYGLDNNLEVGALTYESTGDFVSVDIVGDDLVIEIVSTEINDDLAEFETYLSDNPITIGNKEDISDVYSTVQFMKLTNNLIRVI